MTDLRPSKVYSAVAIAAVVALVGKWQSLGVSDQACVRPAGMGLVEFIPRCSGGPAEWATNSFGVRAEEPGAHALESTYTILYLGWAEPQSGSMANSTLMPSVLEKYLNSTGSRQYSVRVINGSAPSTGGVSQLQSMLRLVKAYRPQLIVYFFVPQSEHIQRAALKRYGAAESSFEVARDLIRLSWMAKMERDPVAVILEPTISDLSELSQAAERDKSKLLVVWPGTGLAPAAWNVRLPSTAESFMVRFLDPLKIMIGSSAERIRLLFGEYQVQYREVADLGSAFWRRMAFSKEERMHRSARVAKRLGEVIDREIRGPAK